METLRISTAGSVDDGKSTLIGRLLYDTNSLPADKIEAIKKSSNKKGRELDLSLITDGLIAEREQGITIDVAHIYFSSAKRKYIIADTPGHVEYTRNMITGSSNSQLTIILIDARAGLTVQTRRHFYISALIRIPNVVVCINKMDLVDYREDVFYDLASSFQAMAKDHLIPDQTLTFIPVSALHGDNIVSKSTAMNWYQGPTLHEHLESVTPANNTYKPGRFPVQYVIRPMEDDYHDYRSYAGRVFSGTSHTGDSVTVLPSGATSTIQRIERFEGSQETAHTSESVALLLDDDIDISRGSWIVPSDAIPQPQKSINARICWLDSEPASLSARYLLQSGTQQVLSKISGIKDVLDPDTLLNIPFAGLLKLNDIASLSIQTALPVFAEPYATNPATGNFILIDEQSNNTVAVGFVEA